MQPAIIMTTPT